MLNAHEPPRRGGLHLAELRHGLVAVLADQLPDTLHQVVQRLALLAHERPAEQRPELTDVASQLGLGVHAWKTSRPRRLTKRAACDP